MKLQTAVILNTCRTVRKFWQNTEQEVLSQSEPSFFENQLNNCEVRNVGDDNNNNCASGTG